VSVCGDANIGNRDSGLGIIIFIHCSYISRLTNHLRDLINIIHSTKSVKFCKVWIVVLTAVLSLFVAAIGSVQRSKRDSKWTVSLLPAFQTYKEIYGHMCIPDGFVVPNSALWPEASRGLKLGSIAEKIRNKGIWTHKSPELQALGFEYQNSKDLKWNEEIAPSLLCFKNLHGHLDIPSKFIVPECSPWPSKALGLKLGSIAATVRQKGTWKEKKEWLKSIGFEFEHSRVRRWRDDIFPAFKDYLAIHGHINIPSDHQTADGVKLGIIACLIRSRGDWLDIGRSDLESIGFDMRKTLNIRWNETIAPALRMYQLLNGDMLVPAHFIVPDTEQWPKQSHGLKLGNIVSHIRSLNNWSEKRNELENMGFDFGDILQSRYVDEILPAFKIYERIYGCLNVPSDFVVPVSHPWPVSTHGLHLGSIVEAIRSHGVKHYKKSKLEDLEFELVQGTFLDWITGTKVEDWRNL